jgi:hypothetical protein
MKTGFFGASYTTQSSDQACNRLINLYPEISEEPNGTKSIGAFYAVPGFSVYCNTGVVGEVRAEYKSSDGKGFAVVGNTVFRLVAGVATNLGTIGTSSGIVSIADNGLQLCIVDGSLGYLVNLTTLALTTITDPDFPNGAIQVVGQDTYFITFQPSTQQFFISANNDGSSWDSLDFGSAEGSPDAISAMISDHRELLLYGPLSTEVFYNSGNADFPFERREGAYIEHGIIAPFSLAKMDNSVFWLGGDDKGSGIVWKIDGYQPQRVSTHAVEFAIRSYATVSDCRSITYQENGHTFLLMIFPSVGKCWAYDAATNMWHERAHFSNGEFTRWRGNCHMFHEGKHLVGDYENGTIYEMSLNNYTYNGDPRKWLRAWRVPANENKKVFYYKLIIDIQAGVGLDGDVQGSNPQMMRRISNDGGHSYGNERLASMGKIGEYKYRTIFRRLGSSRNRAYEISGTDPTVVALIDAYQNALAGTS